MPTEKEKTTASELKGAYDSAKSHLSWLHKWREDLTAGKIAGVGKDAVRAAVRALRALKQATGLDKAGAALTPFEASLTALAENGEALDPGTIGNLSAQLDEVMNTLDEEAYYKLRALGYHLGGVEADVSGKKVK